MTVYGSGNIGESSKMSTSLSQAANLDDQPVPMDSTSSVDKIVTAENVSEHRGRCVESHSMRVEIISDYRLLEYSGAGFSGSTFNR